MGSSPRAGRARKQHEQERDDGGRDSTSRGNRRFNDTAWPSGQPTDAASLHFSLEAMTYATNAFDYGKVRWLSGRRQAAVRAGVLQMSKERQIHCYDYVNHPYEQVRDALREDPLVVFQSATKAAASRARSIASALRVEVGGIGLETDIKIAVKNIEEEVPAGMTSPATRLQFEWEAANMADLFPLMKANLSVYPLTATETQLDFLGLYQPPLGAFGKAVDTVAGRRIAEVSVHRFVSDVAKYLRQALT